jgi:Domain of unknown function (DUF5047)
MFTTTARFRETVVGTHRAVVRVQLLTTIQFGAAPTGGLVLPLLSGDVRLSSTADVKGTLSATVPGDYWAELQPYGCELFVERGVAFGDGREEYVPLGYFRVEKIAQEQAPYGPITIDANDRTAQLQQSRVIYPYQVPADTTHREIVDYLVNGVESGAGTYGMYLRDPEVPIIWDDAGYDPDAAQVSADLVVDDSVYEFLAKLLDSRGAMLRFLPTGELAVQRQHPPDDQAAAYTIRPGVNGTLIRASRAVARTGVYNIVRATGSDPAYLTGYRLAYIADGPLRWSGPFGPSPRYYASPLLRNSDGADAAAETILAKSTGLPEEVSLFAVPDPSLQPLDVVNELSTGTLIRRVIDEVTVPLVGDAPLHIRTKTVNAIDVVQPDPDPVPVPEPDPNDPDPDPDPGPTPDPGDPNDGVQAAVVRGWGSIIDGDEFSDGVIGPKWGLYNGPGHAGNGLRRPSAFREHDGMLTIHGENKVSGGAAFKRSSYGYRVEWRCRVYGTGGGSNDRYHPVLILWPSNDQWPAGAEYDHFETDEGTGKFGLFMHLPNHTPYRQDHVSFNLDIQNWHNYACEWDPSAQILRAFVDGQMVYDGRGRVAQAPGPMHPTFQLDDFGGNPRPCNFDAAWIRVYQRPNA